jgi:predicted RNase H-like nuclease (RuvC/YqgF family)
MGVVCMEITKSCFNCGGVVFNLNQKPGEYEAICSECGTIVANIKLEKYETVKNYCSRCNSGRFKARVKKIKETENWSVECADCKTQPEFKYVDSELKDIDEKTRENLILKDTISELNGRIEELESELARLAYRVSAEDETFDITT